MTNTQKLIGVGIAGVVVGLILSAVYSAQPVQDLSGVYNTVSNTFSSGAVLGDRSTFFKSGVIDVGQNQTAYTNTTGRTLIIAASDINIGWNSGVASSSWNFYTATSSATTVADYSRPGQGGYNPIDGALLATGTVSGVASLLTGTSTSAGRGAIYLQNGESLIFDVQEKHACKGVGNCETATSTNRGVQQFFWNFKATYLP